MAANSTLGTWLRRFLQEHSLERGLSRNTVHSYRDALALLLPFAADRARQSIDRLVLDDLSAECVRAFLGDLEARRGCSPQSRNQRLAAVRSFARYVAAGSPEQVEWCSRICAIPLKKVATAPIGYLDKAELDALLAVPDRATAQGRRERTLLEFLYNSGARVSEAVQLTVGDLQLGDGRASQPLAVLRGKGGKTRQCPLWDCTARALGELVADRPTHAPVFLNRLGRPITRSGVLKLVRRCAARAATQVRSLEAKRVTPHTLRHTTACHLLRAGVDINTIRIWLGHAHLATTNIYAEIDLETKARAIACCALSEPEPAMPLKDDQHLMEFLRSL